MNKEAFINQPLRDDAKLVVDESRINTLTEGEEIFLGRVFEIWPTKSTEQVVKLVASLSNYLHSKGCCLLSGVGCYNKLYAQRVSKE